MRPIKSSWLVASLTLLGMALGISLAYAAPGVPANTPAAARLDAPLTATLSGATTGLINHPIVFTASVSPLTATLPITYVWQATNQITITDTLLALNDVVTFTWASPGAQAVTLTATNNSTPITVSQAITVLSQLYLPLVIKKYHEPVFPPPAGSGWLAYVNYYRALESVQPVTEDPALTDGTRKHAHYMALNNIVTPYELSFISGYTPEGAKAAPNSNLLGSSASSTSDDQAIAIWMQGPFHALGILDPALQRTGFGSDHDTAGSVQMAAALDIISGLDETQIPAGTYPVMWPGDGMTVTLRSYTAGTDSPEPLTSCPGYTTTAGLPIILQLGNGSLTAVNVTATSLRLGGVLQDHCSFTQATYQNPDTSPGGLQDVGRAILGARNAVVLIPHNALTPGGNYTVSITANGQTYTWSFMASN